MNDILAMQYCKTTKSIPQDPFPCSEWYFLLGEAEQVVSGKVVYEDRLFGDNVAHESEVRATLVRNEVSLHIAGWLKQRGGDLLEDKLVAVICAVFQKRDKPAERIGTGSLWNAQPRTRQDRLSPVCGLSLEARF